MIQNSYGKLHIKRLTFAEMCIWLVFILPFLFPFLMQIVGLPGFLRYTVDVFLICLFAVLLVQGRTSVHKSVAVILIVAVCFATLSFFVYLCNYQSFFYFFWGARNNIRFYTAFAAFVMFLKRDEADDLLSFMDKVFWINAVCCVYQYLVLGYQQDYLGGIFGTEKGCNGYTIIFLGLMFSKSILLYMNNKGNALKCLSECAVCILVAALAECKFLFVVFVIVLVMATVLTSFSWRKFALLFVCALLIMVGSSLLVALFGFEDFLSFEKIWAQATRANYSTEEDLNRLTAIPTISKTILTDTPSRLFGLGLGNCDTSDLAVFNTPFYQEHAYLHYTWISSAFLFLETGYIGLIIYLLFFVLCYLGAREQMKKRYAQKLWCQMAMIAAVFSVILTFYNASMRTEAGYMVYFVMALPFLKSDKKQYAEPNVGISLAKPTEGRLICYELYP